MHKTDLSECNSSSRVGGGTATCWSDCSGRGYTIWRGAGAGVLVHTRWGGTGAGSCEGFSNHVKQHAASHPAVNRALGSRCLLQGADDTSLASDDCLGSGAN
jgi:hypothetical protein